MLTDIELCKKGREEGRQGGREGGGGGGGVAGRDGVLFLNLERKEIVCEHSLLCFS